MNTVRIFLAVVISAVSITGAIAQGTAVAFGSLKQDTSLPVEVTAEHLNISQVDGIAIFTGEVLVGQGEMRLSADTVRVEYDRSEGENSGKISRLIATGNVVLVNGKEAAESEEANYDVIAGTILMTGDVILTQGGNALASDTMTVDLNTGIANMSGRVSTIFTSKAVKADGN